ncbi:hypothetical protein PGT21_022507 [Puccinia graminis f. sp. tritici]|nr:hypothetical protein PGT21_022507 [Puccinia graminis f. sp. tritici]
MDQLQVRASGFDQHEMAGQCQRFLDLHRHLVDPEKAFHDFFDVVGLKTIEEHLDHLETLCRKLKQDTDDFSRLWCQLLERDATFKNIQLIWETESDRSLEENISQLAFLQQYPRLSQKFHATHEQRIQALNSSTSLEAEALFVSTGSTFDQESTAAQWQRFLNLHPELVHPEESFKDFLDIVGLKTLKEHLDHLESLCETSTHVSKTKFGRLWSSLLNRTMKFDVMQLGLGTGSDQSLQAHISQLAFLQQHPGISRDYETTHHQRVEALDSSTSQEAEACFARRPNYETLQGEIVAEGYDRTYTNAERIVIPTLKILQDFAAAWLPAKYVAPYTALIAPSLNGKTRLLKELSRHICVVYICIRPDKSTGYPPRSEWAYRILIDVKRKSLEKQYDLLLLAILHAVATFFEKQKSQMATSDRMESWINHSFPKKHRSGDPPFWLDVQKQMESLTMLSEKESAGRLKDALSRMKKSTSFLGPTNLNLLLAIDEASQLLYSSESPDDWTFFRILRRTLAKIPSASGVFAILADTTSRVSNFTPPGHLDPSHRPGKPGLALFDPIYQIATFDTLVSAPPTTWQQLQSAFRLLRYGSPFFGVYVDVANEKQGATGIVQDLIHFALEKLLGLTDRSIDPSSLTDSQVIALLGSTIQPQLYGASHLNVRLVASHAAQCLFIDPSRQFLISEYPSQITFSSAANQYLAIDEARLIRCIEILTSTRQQGHVGPGDIGELVSRVVLLRAMQETMRKNQPKPGEEPHPEKVVMPFGHPVRLVDFLKTLTGLNRSQLKLGSITTTNKKKLLDDGQLFWNHFVCIEHTPNSEDFLSQLHRGAAVQCKPNQHGFDQLFPIYLLPKGQERLDKKNITFCGIQVKNKMQTENLAVDSDKWTPDFAKIDCNEKNPYLVLFFSLRDSKTDLIPIPVNPKSKLDLGRRASQAFYSLSSFKFLSEGLKNALTELINTHPSVSLLHDKSLPDTKAYAKTVSPLVSSTQNQKRKR